MRPWQRRLAFTFRQWQERLSPRRLTRLLATVNGSNWYWIPWPFHMMWRGVTWFGGVLAAWWRVRNLRYLLQGLPALFALIAVGVTGAYAYFRSGDGLFERYKREAEIAYRGNDFAKASLCWERLYSIDARPPEVRFGLAMAAMGENRFEYAADLIDQLAPADSQGYCLAHLERGRRLFNNPPNQEVARLAEVHLRRALTPNAPYPLDQFRSREARYYLGRLYLNMNRLDDAFANLTIAATQFPEVHLDLAELYLRRQQKELSREHARMGVEHFRRLAEEDMSNIPARLAWANGLRLLDDYEESIRVLIDGYNVNPNPRFKIMLSLIYMTWAEDMAKNPTGSEIERLAYLERSLLWDPGNLRAMQGLVALIRGGTESADRAKALIRRLLAENGDSAFLHFTAGCLAFEEGKLVEARHHWEISHKLSKDLPIVANNLAWLLATEPPVDRQRALEIIDAAINAAPDQPVLHGTRGFILAALGRHREAIIDLERSTPVNRDRYYFHDTLADCFDRVGNKTQAEEHRQMSKLLRDRMREGMPVRPGTGS
ncbi:MAG TPA: hypothetical protein PKD86_12975 [Gemmatales bacterium]|nr:hypothetical protein [Gemmatales bacterium]